MPSSHPHGSLLNRSWLGAWRARTVKERPPVRLASLWTSTHCRAKNSPGRAGWESQQQRRKLRPGSQISSASAAVFVRAGRCVGSHVSIIVSQRGWAFSEQTPGALTLPQHTQEGLSCSPLRKSLLSYFSLYCATAGPLNAFITQQGGCWFVGTQQLLHLEAAQTQLAKNRLSALFFPFQFTPCNNL